jgi:predicted nucleic acid-binding protein
VILCDTGPLVALVDGDDPHHSICLKTAGLLPANSLITTWPCLTEAMHLLNRASGLEGQNGLWSYLSDGMMRLYLPKSGEWQRIHGLMNEYPTCPSISPMQC